MANILYAWTPGNIYESAPNSVTTSVYSQNVELQNCQNSVKYTAQFFCGRFIRSRLLILLLILILYTVSGAFVFHLIESPAEMRKHNQTTARMKEAQNELITRIISIRTSPAEHGSKRENLNKLVNLTYAALWWYENELKRQLGMRQSLEIIGRENYLRHLTLMGAASSTVGFQLDNPLTTSFGRLIFVIFTIPGIFIFIASARSIGQLLFRFYTRSSPFSCLFPHSSGRTGPESLEFWQKRIRWLNLLPFPMALLILAFIEISTYHYFAPAHSDYVSSIYSVTLSLFTIGPPRSLSDDYLHPMLLTFAFLWLTHFACFCHAVAREKEIFKHFLMAWLQKNKEDAIFIKLCLLRSIGTTPALADTLMSKCTEGSIYRKLLFRLLTIDEKVEICRHLTWKGDDGADCVLRINTISSTGRTCCEASIQVDLDKELLIINV